MKLAQLVGNRLFQGVNPEGLRAASLEVEVIKMAAGQVIFSEGDPGEKLFLIIEGKVNIIKGGGDREAGILSTFGEGEFFGEMAVLDPAPRSASAVVATDCLLGVMSKENFDQVLALAPAVISRNLTREVIGRLREFNDRFIEERIRQERLGLVGSMVAGIMHDFRNPIATILTACELVAMRAEDPRVERYCGTINRSIDRMMSMIQELLDFSRGSSGAVTKAEVDAAALLQELNEQGLDAMETAGISVVREIKVKAPLCIDTERVVRMLLNIIKNAREAMEDKGSFWFRIFDQGKEVVFQLKDSGPGIPPDLLPRLFEPFVTQGKKGGTGLGLAIAKSVVDGHGGTIQVQSVPGEGTLFEIRFPR